MSATAVSLATIFIIVAIGAAVGFLAGQSPKAETTLFNTPTHIAEFTRQPFHRAKALIMKLRQ